MSPTQHNGKELKASRILVENYVKAFAVGEQLLRSKNPKKVILCYLLEKIVLDLLTRTFLANQI